MTKDWMSLAQWCSNNGIYGQQVASEFVGEYDTGLRVAIESISKGSHKRVKWRCKEGHEWFTAVSNRTFKQQGCRDCFLKQRSLQKAKNGSSILAWCNVHDSYGAKVISEWVGETEDGSTVDISEVSYGSVLRVKWRCNFGHEWIADPKHRLRFQNGCPVCARIAHGKSLSESRLVRGENDLESWCRVHPDIGNILIKEWQGELEDGQRVQMSDLCYSTKKMAKWRCINGHVYFSRIVNRVHGKGCKQCASIKLSKDRKGICFNDNLNVGDNDLATWCLEHQDRGEQLSNEWLGLTEDNKPIDMTEIARASHKSVQWRCKYGHIWSAPVSRRTSANNDCPYCSGLLPCETNNLDYWCTQNGNRGTLVRQEFMGQCEDGTACKLTDFVPYSTKKVKWVCMTCGNEWLAQIDNRTLMNYDCPDCGKLKQMQHCADTILQRSNLEKWCSNNGAWGAIIREQFDGLDENNNAVSLSEVTAGNRQRVWWHCSRGHRWLAPILNRTRVHSGCPECSVAGTSYPELYLYYALKQVFPEVRHREKFFKCTKYPNGLEYDIAVDTGDSIVLLEYSPTYWHRGREERDRDKQLIAEKLGFRFINIIEDSYSEMEECWSPEYICFHMEQEDRVYWLNKILNTILSSLSKSVTDIDLEKVELDVYSFLNKS